MNVLFVSSGNSKNGISSLVFEQGESLRSLGYEIDYYLVKGKGLWGYLSNITKISKFIKQGDYDIVHSHYSFCGIVSALATEKPVVCSLMGSDVKKSGLWRFIIKYFIMHKWKRTIVKSKDMKLTLGIDKVEVIPNGVDLDIFRPMNKNDCRKELGWDIGNKIILFAADPKRPEKNFSLAKKATETLNIQDVELKVVYPVPHKDIPIYLNAADLLLSTSLWEGSPNIIKEAMACNCPIVSTNVGDVKWLLDGVEGCFITTNDPKDVANKIRKALDIKEKTKGREKLISLGLDSEHIAKMIIQVYEEVIYNTSKKKVYGR